MRIDGIGLASTSSNTSESYRAALSARASGDEQVPESARPEWSGANQSLSPAERKFIPVSEKAVLEAIERANKSAIGASTKVEFSIHEKTKQIMVKVLDRESNELIREIPPEKILDMIAGIWEAVGLFVDERR